MTTGLWRKRSIPHKGWTHHGVRDLGAGESQTCAMCEVQIIRFVHTVSHRECKWLGPLQVGVECAGALTGDRKHAADEQKKAAAKSARRNRFPDQGLWRRSRKGGSYLRTRDGYTATVTPKPEGWHVAACRTPTSYYIGPAYIGTDKPKWVSNRRLLPDQRAARVAAFDLIENIKARSQ